ncbi:hypothetical protein K6V98_04185 [Collinsella sp. AGMB00827]|uniref:Uncharacterized protein n=1 Tax=Collinsella ureilytica TaxID=2869515 RepID=A0ABS7MJL9_9ACTN|nr:DUF6724 family protein [Collinsella urealyticum]MBY4797554.1 hypothetical protein [Collinsella urealyticum]
MDAFFTFLFGTREGLAVLFVGGLVVFGIAAFLLEKRTGQLYVDRGEDENGDDGFWS